MLSRLYHHHRTSAGQRQAGFSLVEIVVALVIGMLGMIVIMQVFGVFEGQKRSTSSGNEAQNNGAIALAGLQRDIQQSGYGISDLNLLACGLTLPSGATLTDLAPVTINPAAAVVPLGDTNTDTLLVVYGNGNNSVLGSVIGTQSANTVYPLTTTIEFTAADRVIARPVATSNPALARTCSLTLDTVSAVATSSVTVAPGVAGVTNGQLYDLGAAPVVRAYAIRSGNLTVCNYMANNCGNAALITNSAVWVPIANGIVSMKAQYGKDSTTAAMVGIVDKYDQASAVPAAAQSTSSQCGWARISAVRIALVARSGQYSSTAVTTSAPSWAGTSANNPAGSAANPIVLSADTNWQRYRYKVFETTIPIRNIVWMGVQSTC